MRYFNLLSEIARLTEGFVREEIGKSTFGEPIIAYHVGSKEGAQVIVQGAMHAREFVTAAVTAMLARNAKTIDEGGIYFVPISNPDGVRLSLDGSAFLPATQRSFLSDVNGGTDFKLWKANANAVDLNTNFPANWGSGRANRKEPSAESFIGYYPASERETRVLIDFTRTVSPKATLSFHTKGEVIYYGFEGESPMLKQKSRALATKLAVDAGYLPMTSLSSAGGYKDWCVDVLKIPAFTVECGADTLLHPVGLMRAEEIFRRVKNLPLIALNEVL